MSLTLNTYPAPHIRYRDSARTIMGDVVLVLLIVYAMAFFFYGWRALSLGLWSVGLSMAADLICNLVGRRRVNTRDYSAIVTGLLIPLMMPATVPYKVVAVAVIVAIVVAKHPFGGVGNNVFNPAATGFSFAAICYADLLFVTYPNPLQRLPVFLEEAEVLTDISPAFRLMLGGVPQHELVDMALGKFPGPMGATNILVVVACLIYLILRGTVRWEVPVAFFSAVSLFALLFPRADVSGPQSVALELMSGLILFSGVFLLGDPVTTPKRNAAKFAFGATAGIMAMLFRRFGNLEEGVTFAVLIMNAAVWSFDMLCEHIYSRIRRRRVEVLSGKKIQKKA